MLNGQSFNFSSFTLSASASLIVAEPRLRGFGVSCEGAQPVMVMNSKVAVTRLFFEFWLSIYLSDVKEKSFRCENFFNRCF